MAQKNNEGHREDLGEPLWQQLERITQSKEEQRLCCALSTAELIFPQRNLAESPQGLPWGTHSPCHSTQAPSWHPTALLGTTCWTIVSGEADRDGLLCTSDLLEIDLQEKSPETERGKRRALLRGGTRAQMANLVPRGQKREKLARSELKKRSVLHCK